MWRVLIVLISSFRLFSNALRLGSLSGRKTANQESWELPTKTANQPPWLEYQMLRYSKDRSENTHWKSNSGSSKEVIKKTFGDKSPETLVDLVVTHCCGRSVQHLVSQFEVLKKVFATRAQLVIYTRETCDIVGQEVQSLISPGGLFQCRELANVQSRDSYTLAQHIINRFDDMAPITFIIQDHNHGSPPIERFSKQVETLMNSGSSLDESVQQMAHVMNSANWTNREHAQCNDWAQERGLFHPKTYKFYSYMTWFHRTFLKQKYPSEDVFFCAGIQFGVTREQVHRRSKSFYVALRNLISSDSKLVSNGHFISCHDWAEIFERLFPHVFASSTNPSNTNQDEGPLCGMKDSELCIDDGEEQYPPYEQWQSQIPTFLNDTKRLQPCIDRHCMPLDPDPEWKCSSGLH